MVKAHLFLFQMLPIVVISTCILQLAFLGLGIWDLTCSKSVSVHFAYWYAVIQGNVKCLTKIKLTFFLTLNKILKKDLKIGES